MVNRLVKCLFPYFAEGLLQNGEVCGLGRTCNKGFHRPGKDSWPRCAPCSSPCATCNAQADKCTSCVDGYYEQDPVTYTLCKICDEMCHSSTNNLTACIHCVYDFCKEDSIEINMCKDCLSMFETGKNHHSIIDVTDMVDVTCNIQALGSLSDPPECCQSVLIS